MARLDSQLGALHVAEEFVRFLALAAEGRDGGAVGPREMDCEDSRSGHHGDQQDDDRGEEAGDARVTAAAAAEVLDSGDAPGEHRAAIEEAVEVVSQRVGVGVAEVGLLLQALQADRLQISRYPGPEPGRRHRLLGADLLDRVGRRRSPKGRSACEQFVKDRAQGVLVDEWAGVMGLAAGLLRGHVIWRADNGAGAGLVRVVAEAFGQAEVGDLGTAVGGHEDVGRLEVAVDYPLDVGSVDGAGEDADGPRGLSDVLRPAVNLEGEAATVDEFETEVGEAACLADVVDPGTMLGVLEGLATAWASCRGTSPGRGGRRGRPGQDHLERDQVDSS